MFIMNKYAKSKSIFLSVVSLYQEKKITEF